MEGQKAHRQRTMTLDDIKSRFASIKKFLAA
jgi:hypothetical protein